MKNIRVKKKYKSIIAFSLVISIVFSNLTFAADGNYNRTDSSYEISNGENDEIESYTYETIYHFNILEITRGEGMGTFGYSLDGYEPVLQDISGYDEEKMKEMRHACMDALVNRINGGDQNESKDELPSFMSNMLTQFSDGEKKPFSTKHGKYTGYYKHVGKGEGFYSLINGTLDKSNHKAKMVSKFYTSYVDSDRDNDYIWVDTSLTLSELLASDSVKSDDIVVTDHRKNKYINNNVFFKNFYTTEGSVEDWKKNHKIQLRTKACTALKDEDIEWADFIYLTNGKGVYAQSAYEVYKAAHPGKTFPDIDNLPHLDLPTFKQTLEIYDRVAVREDVAILVDGKDRFTGGKINTNYMKLIAMLFLVNNIHNNDGKYGSGREMFMDYIKSYVANNKAPGLRTTAVSNKMNGLTEENGYMYQDFPRTKVERNDDHDDSANEYFDLNGNFRNEKCYFKKSKSNTTDYIYINEENGNFTVDNQYSGRVFWVDYEIYNNSGKQDGFAHRFISWTRQSDKLGGSQYNNRSEWPWDIVEGSCLKYWWVAKDVTDQQAHLPLYFQYYSNDPNSWGPYRAISDPVQGTYKNQSFSHESGAFKGDLVKDAIEGRPHKREYEDPEHGEKKGTPQKKYYFLSVNIENGDGVNKALGGNKVLYVNDYEIKDNIIAEIPLQFVVRSSENITKIEVLKNSGASPILTFTPTGTNDIANITSPLTFTGGVTLNPKDMSRPPEPDTDHHSLLIYRYSGDIKLNKSYFDSGSNNKFIIRVWVQPMADKPESARHVDDQIYVVKRNFFELN